MFAPSSQTPLFASELIAGRSLRLGAYVPVLLDKRGELQALAKAGGEVWDSMTPLIQMVPADDRGPDEKAFSIADWIARLRRVVGDHLIYLDPGGVARRTRRSKVTPPALVEGIYAQASRGGLSFMPVYTIGRSDTAAVVAGVAHAQGRGLAVRVRLNTLTYTGARRLVDGMLAEFEDLGIAPTSADLMVDLGYLDRDADIDAADLDPLFAELERAAPWRTVTLAATTVPASFADVVRDGELGGVPRREWNLWKGLRALGHESLRYSDYAIQNCVPPDPMNAKNMRASIRYGVPDWLFVARGVGPVQSLPREEKAAQYQDLAVKLMLHPPFVGRACCDGDRFIEECADGLRQVRAQQVWREIGTLHHLHMITLAIADYTAARAVTPRRRSPTRSSSDAPVAR
jgi:hypothetical protein